MMEQKPLLYFIKNGIMREHFFLVNIMKIYTVFVV